MPTFRLLISLRSAGRSSHWKLLCHRSAVFAACCLLLACKRDAPNPGLPIPATDCELFPIEHCDYGRENVSTSPVYELPCFNPTNGDEFVYRRGKTLWKYSFSSGLSTILVEDVRPITQPSWGRSGWIAFTNIDWKMWVVREDGSELKQISNTPRDFGPEFDPSGDEIIYGRSMEYSNFDLDNNPELREQYKLIIVNPEGVAVDSFCRRYGQDQLCYPWDFCSWSPDGQLFAAPDRGVVLYDLDGDEVSTLYEAGADVSIIYDIQWHPDNQHVFFTDNLGLHVVDVSTKQLTTLSSSCDSRTYLNISISPDGETLIAGRITGTYADCIVTQTKRIVKMNMDGSEEEIIDLE